MNRAADAIFIVFALIGIVFACSLLFSILWNGLMARVFGLPRIDPVEAWGMLALAWTLTGGPVRIHWKIGGDK